MTGVVCPPEHKHAATSTCYTGHHCRCADCREGARIQREDHRKAVAYHRPTTALVDARAAREHIWDLRWLGMGCQTIAVRSGVSHAVVKNLAKRQDQARVRRDIEAAILAVPLDADLNERLDPRGTHRRLQALVAQGWSLKRLSVRLGWHPSGTAGLLLKGWVRPATRDRVTALFEELWDVLPPLESMGDRVSYSHARAHAARMGWVGPLSWDDIDHDDAPAELRRVA